MNPDKCIPLSECALTPTTRRQFLQQTAGLAAGAAVLAELPQAAHAAITPAASRLPAIKLGPHEVTRLIIGGNPIYGYSHFNNILSQYQTAWHTPERVVELIQHAEAQGINTWQNSYAERTLADLDRYRAAGGKMHWLCLGKPDWDEQPHFINDAARRKPIGIAPHGSLGERLYRQNKPGVLTDLLKRIRDTGVLVGLSELLGGEVPLGEIYLPSDPPRMFKVIQTTRRPCLAYKILAAGRRIESRAQVRQCFETAFSNLKPIDAVIVGMYQQLSDQVGENAAIVRQINSRGA